MSVHSPDPDSLTQLLANRMSSLQREERRRLAGLPEDPMVYVPFDRSQEPKVLYSLESPLRRSMGLGRIQSPPSPAEKFRRSVDALTVANLADFQPGR